MFASSVGSLGAPLAHGAKPQARQKDCSSAAFLLGLSLSRQQPTRHVAASRSSVIAAAWWWLGGSSQEDSAGDEPPQSLVEDPARGELLQYVLGSGPEVYKRFEERSDAPEVVDAMRTTVLGILGTLPPEHFRVQIALDSPVSLYYLIQSCCLTGYMFASAWTRLDLARSLDGAPADEAIGADAALLGEGGVDDGSTWKDAAVQQQQQYAEGVQKVGVSGEVLRWRHDEGVERLAAEEYIANLEADLARTRRELQAQRSATRRARQAAAAARSYEDAGGIGNELLRHLRSLPDERERQALTEGARSGPVADAIDAFAQRLLAPAGSMSGGGALSSWDGAGGECSAVELAQLLFWSLVVGYELRGMEQRLALRASLEGAPQGGGGSGGGDGYWGSAPPSLPPGR